MESEEPIQKNKMFLQKLLQVPPKENNSFPKKSFFNPKWYSGTISWITIPYKYVKWFLWRIGTKYVMNSDHSIQKRSMLRYKFNSGRYRCSTSSSQQGLPHLVPAVKLICNQLKTGGYLLSAALDNAGSAHSGCHICYHGLGTRLISVQTPMDEGGWKSR